jgi:hypothetical protein
MKPYGVHHIGPACGWGCCYREEHRARKRRRPTAKRARQAAQREVRAVLRRLA